MEHDFHTSRITQPSRQLEPVEPLGRPGKACKNVTSNVEASKKAANISKYWPYLAISCHTVSLVQVNSQDIPRYPKIQKYPDNI